METKLYMADQWLSIEQQLCSIIESAEKLKRKLFYFAEMDRIPPQEDLSSDQVSSIANLNRRLAELENLIKSDVSNTEKSLCEELSDNHSKMGDFEINAEACYVLSEDDPAFKSDDENIITCRKSLWFPVLEDGMVDDWNVGSARFSGASIGPHCFMFHDLYDHNYGVGQTNLSLTDCARVGKVMVDIVIRRQYTLDVKIGGFEKLAEKNRQIELCSL